MATANRTEWADSLRLGGALANDVGELIPFVDTIFTVTRIIVEYVQAAEANHESCEKLAERATSISNTLRTYFGSKDETCTNAANDAGDNSMVECISELESELQSACALVKRFSSPEKWAGKAVRALMAKNFQGEFLTCEARLVELETRLSRIIIFRMSHNQKRDNQVIINKLEAAMRKLEAVPHEMVRALEVDRQLDTKKLENKLGSRPEKGAVLSMHDVEVKSTNSYLHAANAGHASAEPEGSEPWYIEATLAEKRKNVDGTRVTFIPLGDGSSGSVFQGTFNGQEVAIKEIKSKGNKALAVLRNEVGIMWRLSHENVVQTLGGFYPRTGVKAHEREGPFILLEFAPKGSLEKYMFHDSGSSLLSREQLLRIFRCMIDGLKYLHGNKIIHRDMKPQNVLLMDDWTPKISDFGLATVKNSCSFANTMLGTSGYMAPEVIRRKQYSRSCDVWSYGVMLFEMMLGETMFEGGCTIFDILEVLEDPKRGVPWGRLNQSEYARQWPAWVVEIARACLQTTPEKRPTISDIWLEFYDRMGAEGATAAAKSKTPQYAASHSGSSTAKVDALAGKFSHVTVASRESGAASSSTGGSAARPSGSRPVQAQAQAPSADDMLRYAEEWEKAGNMAYAYEYFKLAAEAGAAEGQFRLGKILLDGSHGKSQHLVHGAGWVRAAAEKGRTDAMIEYGRCYHSGRGVTQNWSLAREWYAKAAKLGSSAGSAWLLALEAEEQAALRGMQLEDEKRRMQREREAEEHAATVRQAAEEKRNRLEKEAQDLAEQARREKEVRALAAQRADAEQARSDAAGWQQRGRTAEENKNYSEALAWYRKAAQLGDAYAEGRVGYFYHNGLGGLREDKRAAVEWFRKAAEHGDATAQNGLAIYYENGWCGLPQDKRAAVEWYRKAAEQGYAAAQFNLGGCYNNGEGGLPQDKRAAVDWRRKAAEQGFAAAQYFLGVSYENGWGGLPQDMRAAVEWYRKAAEQGFAEAQGSLGICYSSGEGGLAQDKRAAVEWWRKAAEHGDARAQCNLGTCYGNGWGGLPQDKRVAVEWWRKAAEQGHAMAQCNLGSSYEKGWGGLPQDMRAAVDWWRKAAEQEDAQAQALLGFSYSIGEGGLPEDKHAAVEWLRKAAEQGDAAGQSLLGAFYENGWGGLPQDMRAAVKWYTMAADQGHAPAQNQLKELGY